MPMDRDLADEIGKQMGRQGVFNLRLLEMLVLNGCLKADQAGHLMTKLDVGDEMADTFTRYFRKAESFQKPT